MSLLVERANEAMQSKPVKPVADAGTAVSNAIHNAIVKGGRPTRAVADLLHGTWLGHPLHPVLTDLTIGSWAMGAVFDVIGAVTGSKQIKKTADGITLAGTISAVPTAITGMVDYSTFPEPSASPVTLHAITNVINFGLYTLSVRDRRNDNRRRGVILSTIGLALSCVSAWLGGELVYRYRVGVDHSEDFEGPKKWTPIMKAQDLPNRKPVRAQFDGKSIMLYREGVSVRAIGAVCSHAGGPLDEGQVHRNCVTCPWHHSVFNIRNGAIVHGPATQPQPAFSARIRDVNVEVRLEHS